MIPQASSTDELIDWLAREHLVAADPLRQYLAARGGAATLPADAADAAAELARDGVLTPYQAEQLAGRNAAGLAVGKYRLLARLGSPGCSVYRAQKRPAGPDVAVKLLPLDAGATDAARAHARERFHREAEALARLDHPAVAGIREFGEDAGRLFLVMDYIEGQSLDRLVEAQGPLPLAPAARIIHQAADALVHVHKAGMIHRDLRPAHLMLDGAGGVHILDLGLARFLDDYAGALTRQAGSAAVFAAVEYLAPEQAVDSHNIDIRADVYALGATFYYLLAGKPPFDHQDLLRLAAGAAVLPQPLARVRPDAPGPLVGVVERMMAPRPDDRFQTPAEAAQALGAWLHQVAPPPLRSGRRSLAPAAAAVTPNRGEVQSTRRAAPPPTQDAEPGSPGLTLLAAVVVAVLTALAGLAFWRLG